MLGSVGVPARMHIGMVLSPESLVRADRQTAVSVEEHMHSIQLHLRVEVQTIGKMGLWQSGIYPSLLGFLEFQAGIVVL